MSPDKKGLLRAPAAAAVVDPEKHHATPDSLIFH
jgi:hypothetical protein